MVCPSQGADVSRFEHILSFRPDREVSVAALTLYVDDSGTDPNQPVAIVAGWIAPSTQWKKFIREWEKYKREEKTHCFHTSEAVARNPKSEFANWSDAKLQRVMKKLRYLAYDRATQGFALSVHKQDYDDLVTDDLRGVMGKYHYTYAVRNIIGAIEVWREKNDVCEPIEYIFDRMTKGPSKKEIESVFAQAESESDSLHRYGIYKGCHSFRDKCEITPLQAADIFAWSAYQRILKHATGKETSQIAKETFNYFNRRGKGKVRVMFQTRESLADTIADAQSKKR